MGATALIFPVNDTPDILDQFMADSVPGVAMDMLWAQGFRHFGSYFFRYSLQWDADTASHLTIQPLRLDARVFKPSKNQRRVLSRNQDVQWQIGPAEVSADVQALFHRHKSRFKNNIPSSIFDFISPDGPAEIPCPCLEFRAFVGDALIAVSYLSIGTDSTSGIYGLFDPDHSDRSLGTLTLLKEIEHTSSLGHTFYYPGYSTREPSAYDYKKRLAPLEYFVWTSGLWLPLNEPPREVTSPPHPPQ